MDIDDLLTNRLKLSFMEKIYASNLNAEDYRKFIIPKIQDQFSPGMTFYIGSKQYTWWDNGERGLHYIESVETKYRVEFIPDKDKDGFVRTFKSESTSFW